MANPHEGLTTGQKVVLGTLGAFGAFVLFVIVSATFFPDKRDLMTKITDGCRREFATEARIQECILRNSAHVLQEADRRRMERARSGTGF